MHIPEKLALSRTHSESNQFPFFILDCVEMIKTPPGIAQFCQNKKALFCFTHPG
ncbi:hypothetical protein SeGA_1766 [Salmonella enterica subsp. enterica serovar Gaminara str. A4-567]|nr:hypothetical protein SeGA_1766 [Salmonella enterica subsp. enterica serovar Gaminara str. A4-567]